MTISPEALLSRDYGRDRCQLISDVALPLAQPGLPQGGTVYLAAADGELMVSLIQSNYMGFGSGILVPGTGVALHDRGMGFSLQPGHPNGVAPGKRPFHTIMPGFLTRNGQALGAFGVMGASMQPQGHLQVVVNLADYGMNPQAALDAPRWRFMEGNRVFLERTVANQIATELAQRQHHICRGGFFGRGQVILRQDGVLVAGSEPRADGIAIAL
jgi:gamma-glutamyltranspeptidase / glutathione hydrolase